MCFMFCCFKWVKKKCVELTNNLISKYIPNIYWNWISGDYEFLFEQTVILGFQKYLSLNKKYEIESYLKNRFSLSFNI